jgi:cysteine synthase
MLDGKEWKSIPKAELGMEYNVEETVNKVMANHNSWAWFMPYFKAPENVAIATKGADEKAVEKKISGTEKKMLML